LARGDAVVSPIRPGYGATGGDGDGHGLSRHPHQLWQPFVDAFLATIDFPARTAGTNKP
jgi:hypothetical protein